MNDMSFETAGNSLFVKMLNWLLRLTTKKTLKLCILSPMWVKTTGDRRNPQNARDAESISMSWRHHVLSSVVGFAGRLLHGYVNGGPCKAIVWSHSSHPMKCHAGTNDIRYYKINPSDMTVKFSLGAFDMGYPYPMIYPLCQCRHAVFSFEDISHVLAWSVAQNVGRNVVC